MADGKKLPVFETVGNAISYSVKNIPLMIRLGWFWVVILIVVTVAVLLVAWALEPQAAGEGQADAFSSSATFLVAVAVILVVYLAAIYSIAVGWHRGLLLGEKPGLLQLSFGRREMLYFGYALAITLVGALGAFVGIGIASAGAGLGLPQVLAAVVGGILVGAAVIGMMMLIARTHLVLPGVAVGDRRMSLRWSFELTEGNTWRIVGGFLLIGLLNAVVNVLSTLVEQHAATASPWAVSILALFVIVAGIVVAFITLSYMSYCYWFFVPPPEEGDLV